MAPGEPLLVELLEQFDIDDSRRRSGVANRAVPRSESREKQRAEREEAELQRRNFERRAELRRRAALLKMLRRNIEAIELTVAEMRNALNNQAIPRTSVPIDTWEALSIDDLTLLAHYGDSAIETDADLEAFFQLVKRTNDVADRLAADVQAKLLTHSLDTFVVDMTVLDSSCAKVESLAPIILAALQSRLHDIRDEESAMPVVTPSTTGIAIKTP